VPDGAVPAVTADDWDDVRAALEWTVGYAPHALDRPLIEGIERHLTARGRFAEAHRLLAAAGAAATDPEVRATALLRAGVAADRSGAHHVALDLARQADAEFTALGRGDHRCATLVLTGAAWKALGNPRAAYRAYQQALRLAQDLGNERYALIAINNLGTIAHDWGRYRLARLYYTRNLERRRALGDACGIAVALCNLGDLARCEGRLAEARQHLTEAVERFRELDDPYSIAFGLALLAGTELDLGDRAAATTAAEEAAGISRRIEHPGTIAMAELARGDIALAGGDYGAAARSYRVAAEHATEQFDLARIYDRLAAATAASAPEEARSLLERAAAIRLAHRYAVPPVERDRLAATRRLLASTDRATADSVT
jgi:tetratricopeptide (TPR) repeat protein